MPSMKRPAAAPASAGKRGRPADPAVQEEKKRASIIAALEKADLSESTLDLLRALLPALRPPPRHEFQQQAADMLEGELLKVEKAFRAKVAELEGSMSNVEGKRTVLQQAAEEAQTFADTKAASVAAAKELLDQAVAKFKEANDLRSKEELSKKQLLESIDAAAEKIQCLQKTVAFKESLLKGEEGSSEQLDSNLRLLVEDTNLLDAVKKCMQKVSSEHSNFEKLVLQQLDGQLAAAEKKLVSLQIEGPSQKEQAEHKLSVAAEKLDVCLEAKASAQEAWSQAAEAKKEADKVTKTAKAELKAFEASVPGMQKKLDSSRAQLEAFVAGPKAHFTTLTEFKPPEVETEDVVTSETILEPKEGFEAKVVEPMETSIPLAAAEATP